MDLAKIKKLIRQNGDKFIFLENDEPELVVMSFKEYEKLAMPAVSAGHAIHTTESFESPIKSFMESQYDGRETKIDLEESAGLPVRLEDIRLEDLPI